jgi:16S rRNA (cytosine1402-N4)-methyltransferase
MDEQENIAKPYDYHQPVLLNESIEYLITKKDGVYVDGTLGGAGHAAKILDLLMTRGKLLAFDRDINSIEYSKRKLGQFHSQSASPKLLLFNECYSASIARVQEIGSCDGFFLDLGISSHQIDTPSIGLSYRFDSPLDMRFSPEGASAYDLLQTLSEKQIVDILYKYGEEPKAYKIARSIIARRKSGNLKTTFDLREAVEPCVSQRDFNKTLARVFQAFRIAVNGELETLEYTLTHIIPLLNSGRQNCNFIVSFIGRQNSKEYI